MTERYLVTLRFQYPAHDEMQGLHYEVTAKSRAEANARARFQAMRDGHIPSSGQGRATFSAIAASQSEYL